MSRKLATITTRTETHNTCEHLLRTLIYICILILMMRVAVNVNQKRIIWCNCIFTYLIINTLYIHVRIWRNDSTPQCSHLNNVSEMTHTQRTHTPVYCHPSHTTTQPFTTGLNTSRFKHKPVQTQSGFTEATDPAVVGKPAWSWTGLALYQSGLKPAWP